MEHLIAHLNHPRVVSLQATADAIYGLMPLKTVPEGNEPSDVIVSPLSSNSMESEHPAARLMQEFWCIFFEVAKNVPHWHPAQERLQNLIKKLVDRCEAGAEAEKKERMSGEGDDQGETQVCFEPLPTSHSPFRLFCADIAAIANIPSNDLDLLPGLMVGPLALLLRRPPQLCHTFVLPFQNI